MLKFAIRNLFSRPVRSILALLGLTVAIAGMVGLFSVAEGLDSMVNTTFGRIPGLLAMQPGAPVPLFSSLPAEWGEEIEEIEGVSVVNPNIWQRVNLINNEMVVSPPRFLFGADISSRLALKADVYRDDMIAGRYLTLKDQGTRNVVISKPIANEFNLEPGDIFNVNGYDLTVVGIYFCESLLLDVAIILDIDEIRSISRFGPDLVSSFYVETTKEFDDEEMIDRIQRVFVGRDLPAVKFSSQNIDANPIQTVANFFDRALKSFGSDNGKNGGEPEDRPINENNSHPNEANGKATDSEKTSTSESSGMSQPDAINDEEFFPLEVRNANDWAKRFTRFSRDLNIFLAVLTGIGVTIAVLSIVNTMLMSVSERIVEFGILKANGWTKTDVLKLVTFESSLLGLAGGVLGCLFGFLATQFFNHYFPTRAQLYASPELLAFSLAFSILVGVIGGLYPAVWAMRMMPMDAIRRG